MTKTNDKAKDDNSFDLSDGTKVVKGNDSGNHLVKARRVADGDNYLMPWALAAQLCTFNGETRTMEDILSLPMDDCLLLEKKVLGNDR